MSVLENKIPGLARRVDEIANGANAEIYQLLETITVGPATLTFTKTEKPNAQPYNLKRFLLKILVPTASANTNLIVDISFDGVTFAQQTTLTGALNTAGTRYAFLDYSQEYGYWQSRYSSGGSSPTGGMALSRIFNNLFSHDIVTYPTVKALKFTAGGAATIPENTTIQIWGIE